LRSFNPILAYTCIQAKAIVDVEVAVEKGDLATVQDCLAKGVDVDTRADVRRSASKDYSIFEVFHIHCLARSFHLLFAELTNDPTFSTVALRS